MIPKKEWQLKEEHIFKQWVNTGVLFYAEGQIEPYVKEFVSMRTSDSFHVWLEDVLRGMRCGSKKPFCKVNNQIYLSKYGYLKLIELLERRGQLKHEDALRWIMYANL